MNFLETGKNSRDDISGGQEIKRVQINTNSSPLIHSFIPLACAECDDSLPVSVAFSILLCYVLFPTTLLHQLFFHPVTSSCHLFLCLPLILVPKFIYNSLLGILFSSILCTCPNQRNLFNLIVSIIVGFLHLHKFLYWLISSNFLFHCHIQCLKFFYRFSFQKCSIAFYLSLSASKFLMYMLTFCVLLCLSLVSLICFYFLKKIRSIKYILLAFFILS